MRILSLLLVCLLPLTAQAHQFTLGELTVKHPWLRATIGTLRNTAGYMTVTNSGSTPQRLVAVDIQGADKVEMHETKDGMMMLVEAVEIPAGGSVTFQPDGWHLMVGPLSLPLNEGDTVEGALLFEPAGRLPVIFKVDAANATESHDHN